MNIGERFYCSKCLREIENDEICPHCGYDPSREWYSSALEEGTLLYNGRYQLGAVLGHGGFGITYAAWDLVLDMPVAIKEYYPKEYTKRNCSQSEIVEVIDAERFYYYLGLQTFIREARILASLRSVESVVNVFDCFEDNNTAYIVMEYVRGDPLSELCWGEEKREKKLLKVLRPVVDALSLVHKAGVLHRDISPQNIIIQKNGEIKIIDFGASTLLKKGDDKNYMFNRAFAAPEQYEENGKQGFWTDVYGLAATIYNLLTGETIPSAQARADGVSISKQPLKLQKVSKRLQRVLFEALELNVSKRTQTMEDFKADLYDLPRPIMTRKQKIRFVGKIAVWVVVIETLAVCIGFIFSEKIPRQIQLSLKAYVTQDSEAGLYLADEYLEGGLGKEEFDRNIDLTLYWLLWAAERGNTDAMFQYAYLFAEGHYVEKNMPIAVEYYEKAAANGHAVAMNNLGVHYLNGDLSEPDYEKALSYFMKAAESELPLALTNLGKIYIDIKPDAEKATNYLLKAESLGDIEAFYVLGLCYREGFGVQKSNVEYLRRVYEAAYHGWEPAMCEIGRIYKNGELFVKDYTRAIEWFEEGFSGESFYEMGLMYRDGLGVDIDPEAASQHMFTAVMYGFNPAKEEMEKMAQDHYGIFDEDAQENIK